MEELINKLQKYNVKKIIESIENNERQYIAIKNLYFNLKNKDFYLFVILINSLVCYQLSWKWEDYWEEFSYEIWKNNFKNIFDIKTFFIDFLKNSKWNKRLFDIKIKRIDKILTFYEEFFKNEENYYNNLILLQNILSNKMNQVKNAKTIVFALKMFNYWSRVKFNKINTFPFNINIPLDSRLINIYNEYCLDQTISIEEFYVLLSKKSKIPPLHLDSILWNKILFN